MLTWHVCYLKSLQPCSALWDPTACWSPLSMGFSRHEYMAHKEAQCDSEYFKLKIHYITSFVFMAIKSSLTKIFIINVKERKIPSHAKVSVQISINSKRQIYLYLKAFKSIMGDSPCIKSSPNQRNPK